VGRGEQREARIGKWVALGTAAGLLTVLIVAPPVVFAIFSGVLVGVFLSGLTHWVSRLTRLGRGWSLAIVVLLLLALATALGFLIAPTIGQQVAQLQRDFPASLRALYERVQQYAWVQQALEAVNADKVHEQLPGMVNRATRFLGSALGALGAFIVVSFIGLYFAADPRTYVEGVVSLAPPRYRERARQVFCELGHTLWRWLSGRLALMALNGTITSIGLSLLGVPLALTLGIIAGLLNFIPNFGPILAAVPALLLALMQSPTLALYVLIFYAAYQALDGYVFEPLVEKHSVRLPPAMTVIAQVVLGLLFGSLGVLLAVPLVAVCLVTYKMVYLESVWSEQVQLPGDKEGQPGHQCS
jgi:predicted PurR-regulated permease PerM